MAVKNKLNLKTFTPQTTNNDFQKSIYAPRSTQKKLTAPIKHNTFNYNVKLLKTREYVSKYQPIPEVIN